MFMMDSYILSDNEQSNENDQTIQYELNINEKPINKKVSKVSTRKKTVKKDSEITEKPKKETAVKKTRKVTKKENPVNEILVPCLEKSTLTDNVSDSFEYNNSILVLKQSKKQSSSKYINEDFIRLCIDARVKSNPQGEIEQRLLTENNKYKDDIISFIMYINTNIQNCYLKTITCNTCKVLKDYTEFKELSTSSIGRQKNCITCLSKISVKSVINPDNINLDNLN